MTLKQIITEELLESVDEPARLEEVFRRYSKSKGPFYLALADATSQLYEEFYKVDLDLSETKARRDLLREQVDDLEHRGEDLKGKVTAMEHGLAEHESRLAQVQGLLDQTEAVQAQGFAEA